MLQAKANEAWPNSQGESQFVSTFP